MPAPPSATNATAEPSPPSTQLRSVMKKMLNPQETEELYQLYLRAFGPVAQVAAARHVLSRAEFTEEMTDARLEKYLVLGEQDHPLGMATLTQHLESVLWVSPEYYARRYPAEWAAGTIFYMGFVLIDPRHHRNGAFTTMVQPMLDRVEEVHGVVCWDVCDYNIDVIGLNEAMAKVVRSRTGTTLDHIDTQRYYAMEFPKP